jgi:hypothetical protein
MADKNAPLIPEQGWHCLTFFCRIDFAQWQLLTGDEQRTAKIALSEIVQEIRRHRKDAVAYAERGHAESGHRFSC